MGRRTPPRGDDDCEATPEWLETGLGEADAHPGAVIQGVTLPAPCERYLLGPFARSRLRPGLARARRERRPEPSARGTGRTRGGGGGALRRPARGVARRRRGTRLSPPPAPAPRADLPALLLAAIPRPARPGAARRRGRFGPPPDGPILAAPYLLDLAHRCRARGGGTSFLPWLALCDALEVATAARGSLRHRIVLLRAPARVRGRESRIGSKPLAAY